jgi:hypothetical protein
VQADVLQQQLRREASMRPSQGEEEAASAPNGESGGADASPLLYELVGVLVHFGQAEHGHYYSFIKEAELQDGKWFEFNDTRVVHFDAKGLEAETFGGKDEPGLNMGGSMGGPQPGSRGARSSQQSAGAWESFTSTDRDRSAYLLFYRRKAADSTRQASQSPRNNQQSSIGHLRGVEQDIARRNLAVQRDRCAHVFLYSYACVCVWGCVRVHVGSCAFVSFLFVCLSAWVLECLSLCTCVHVAFIFAFDLIGITWTLPTSLSSTTPSTAPSPSCPPIAPSPRPLNSYVLSIPSPIIVCHLVCSSRATCTLQACARADSSR